MAKTKKAAPRRLSPEEVAAQHADDPLVRARLAMSTSATAATALGAEGSVGATPEEVGLDGRAATDGARVGLVRGVAGKQVPVADRRRFLEAVRSHSRGGQTRTVKPIIIDLILKTKVTSKDSLRRMLRQGCDFAIWCRNNTRDGEFDPSRDLTEERLSDYALYAYGGLEPSTEATYMSALRAVAGNKPKRRVNGRRVAAGPYPDAIVALLWDTAMDREVWNGIEMRTLLALSFGVGARAEEINQMRASQVERIGRSTIVNVTRRDVLREVPVYGDYAQWLRTRAAQLHSDDYLFRPTVVDRSDSIGSLVRKSGPRTPVFKDFRAERARHTWVCDHLQQNIAYNVLASAADIGPGSNLFADLLPHLPYVTPTQRRRAFDAVHDSRKDNS